MKAKQIWTSACEALSSVLAPDIYQRWIGVIEATGDDAPGCLTLLVPNGFYQDWLEEHYLPLIEKALAASGGENLTISFVVDEAQKPVEAIPAKTMPPTMKAPSATSGKKVLKSYNAGSQLYPQYTFENFVVGPSNNFAHAAALAVADAPGRAYNPLFIHGGTGLGKTHLIQAIGLTVSQKGKGTICYTSCEALMNEFVQATKQNDFSTFRRKYRNADVLMVDDIHFLAGKDGLQEEIFHTFNDLFHNRKQIVLTSDRPISEIANLQKRLVSRFEWGLVSEIEMPDLETRIAILQHKRDQMGLRLNDNAILFIAEHVRSSIRKLEGSLLKAASYESLKREPLANETLEYLLRDTIEQENQSALTIEHIQRAVADYYDIRMGDMTSKQRPQNIALPRQVAMYLCREMTEHSLPSIGNGFGRNHATVLHAHRSITAKMKLDTQFRQGILAIQQRLGAPMESK